MTETANSDEKKLLSVATRSDAQLWLCANAVSRGPLAHPRPIYSRRSGPYPIII